MTEEVNLFELATRKQWRFDSNKGQLTIEDLWDIPLAKGDCSLDNIAIALNASAKSSATESFVVKPRPGTRELAQKLELVKHIITVRLAEVQLAKDAVARKAMKQKIAAIKEKRGDTALEGMTDAELEALEASL